MNLRCDSKSIRIRLTQKEAETLLQAGQLVEALWSPTGLLRHEVRCTDGEQITFMTDAACALRVNVPRSALEAHVQGGAELVSQMRSGADSGEIRLEIDRFSKRRSNG
mgnify:FL=1